MTSATAADDTASGPLGYDPYDRETARNPHPLFRRLREEAPLYYSEQHDMYAVSRFDDVERVHLDRETFISGRGVTLSILREDVQIPPGTVIFEDPPSHTIHRALLSRMFTPRRVSALEPTIRRLCADLLDPHVGAGGFDFIGDLAAFVPMRVIGMLLGVPEDRQLSLRDAYEGFRDRPEDQREDVLTGDVLADYIAWRADHPSDDVVTVLLNAELEDESGTTRRLTHQELLAYVNIVAAAGNETTRMLIGWTGRLLSDHPDQRRRVAEGPALVPSAIEEVLRFEPPALQSCRYVARATEFHGKAVPAGSTIATLNPAANRDESRFADPDRFDVGRPPGHHFSFGFGAHYCLGQALARLEGRIALEEALRRFPDWEVDEDGAEFLHYDSEMRGWKSLPVVTS
jgi:cytochrome P450